MTDEIRGIQVGDQAPEFEMEDESGEKIKLTDLRGEPVVLMFYPFDWSGLCTKEICDMRDRQLEWAETGARVFGISRDSKYSHKAWKESLGLNYSLLADLVGETAKKYGAWNEAAHSANRTTVVIDREGTVRYVIHSGRGTQRDHMEAFEAVREMAVSA